MMIRVKVRGLDKDINTHTLSQTGRCDTCLLAHLLLAQTQATFFHITCGGRCVFVLHVHTYPTFTVGIISGTERYNIHCPHLKAAELSRRLLTVQLLSCVKPVN